MDVLVPQDASDSRLGPSEQTSPEITLQPFYDGAYFLLKDMKSRCQPTEPFQFLLIFLNSSISCSSFNFLSASAGDLASTFI